MEKEVDVLIVGSGPTGLLAAHALTKQNINVIIIEKNKHPLLFQKHLPFMQERWKHLIY
ncbi:FAD-dependent monooxygenase [Priestia endophytica]